MTTKTLKEIAVYLLVGMVNVSQAFAAYSGNPESLGNNGIDVFVLDCGSGTNNARARVEDRDDGGADNPPNILVILGGWVNGQYVAVGAQDNTEGAVALNWSAWTARVGAGAVDYDASAETTAAGSENYRVQANCYGPGPSYIDTGGSLNQLLPDL